MKVKEGDVVYLQFFDTTEYLRRLNTPDEKEDVQDPNVGKTFSAFTGDSATAFDKLEWTLDYDEVKDLSFAEIEEMLAVKKAAYDSAIQAQKMAPVTRYKEASTELFAKKYEYEDMERFYNFVIGDDFIQLPGKVAPPKCLDEARAIMKKRRKGGFIKKLLG